MNAPNDIRYFVHKRILGAAKGFVGGGFSGAARGFFAGGSRGSRRRGGSPTAPLRHVHDTSHFGVAGVGHRVRESTFQRLPQTSVAPARRGARGRKCGAGKVRLGPLCVGFQPPRIGGPTIGLAEDLPGVPLVAPTGTAMVATGSRGAYAPGIDTRSVRVCLPGDVLGDDGMCHAKGSISNKNRAHPRGRRPLGTPGELAALSKAASFGRRMENTVKRMQKLGVLKKPSRRSAPKTTHLLGPGPH